MLINRKTIRIEWGDCDPLGIVYFPRYFQFFDACTAALFERAGLPKREMLMTYGIGGIPIVDMRARFLIPSRFGDDVIVESSVTEWRNSSFKVHHRLLKDDVLAVECLETRVWVARSDTDPEKIKGRTVPREVREKFAAPPAAATEP
jgi:4-hydroxybenzoyl-CoA thioesterase